MIVATGPHGWIYDPPEPCGGISVNGAEPKCCEVHMMPWGHALATPTDPSEA